MAAPLGVAFPTTKAPLNMRHPRLSTKLAGTMAVVGLAMGGTACQDTAAPSVPAPPPGVSMCAADHTGTPCIVAAVVEIAAACDDLTPVAQTRRDELRELLLARRGQWAMWHDGTALFVSDESVAIAGSFNQWQPSLVLQPLCETGLWVATTPLGRGSYPYKQVLAGDFRLDPNQRAFAFDDFAGNDDGRNSLLNTYDSGVGHLERLPEPLCSEALGNCRAVTAYLPPGYDAPTRTGRYPTLYAHDGQNVFDDPACCFGGGGWQLNRTADAMVTSGEATPFVIVAVDHGELGRNDEYGWSTTVGGRQEVFMSWFVDTVLPTAETAWDVDPNQRFVLGSSLGGLISYRLAFAYETLWRGAASLSGAFWPGLDTQTGMLDRLQSLGHVEVALYLDHGGTFSDGGDGLDDSLAVRDALLARSWQQAQSPGCTLAPTALCYHHEVGAQHTEAAWRQRAWRPLQFFFAPR